jgi:uncharacterized protein YjiS (DUF1127 family)
MNQSLSLQMSLRSMLWRMRRWMKERRMVIALQGLDDATLKDIGVSRGEIPWIAQQRCAE